MLWSVSLNLPTMSIILSIIFTTEYMPRCKLNNTINNNVLHIF